MTQLTTIVKGIVHGTTIELEGATGFPDGQEVTVIVRPLEPQQGMEPGEGIRRSAGAWAEAGDEIGNWLEEMQHSRQQDRPEIS